MLQKGDTAPDFSFTDTSGKILNLSDLREKKVVLYFYPKDDTPGCTAEACDFRDHYQELISKGFYVIGVSADAEKSHQKFADKYNLPFPLISDVNKELIKSYGAWGPKKFMGRSFEGILRTTFIIDEQGLIAEVIEKVETKASTSQIFNVLKTKQI